MRNIIAITTLFFLLTTTPVKSVPVEQLISSENQFKSLSHEIFSTFNIDNSWKGEGSYTECLHFIKSHLWKKCINHLSDINNTLPDYNSAISNILYGISYDSDEPQLALDYYNKIPPKSNYYIHAQLNIALLHARFNRPRKASRLLERLLRSNEHRITDEMTNKLYLIQGHIYFLSRDFSSSRDILSKIDSESQYINNATATLAMGHLYQGDFETAKQYLKKLSDKQVIDASVDTSYILLAFTNSQYDPSSRTTIKSYKNAIHYYKKRLVKINALISKINSLTSGGLPVIRRSLSSSNFIIENNMLDLSRNLPESFLSNYVSLSKLDQSILASGKGIYIYDEAERLHKDYETAVVNEAKNRLIIRKAMLSRYLNQCTYALARLLYQHKLQ